jgi:serine/threonine-protein kinase
VPEAEVSRIGREVLAGLAAAMHRGSSIGTQAQQRSPHERRAGEDPGLRPRAAGPTRDCLSPVRDRQRGRGRRARRGPSSTWRRSSSAGAADARSDLWAVGLLLYELATGARPWKDSRSGALVAKILQDPPEPPRRVRPDLSPGMERIVLRCLEKDPKNRLSSALELGSKLRQLETGANVTPRATRWQLPRIPIPVWITLLVVALASAFLVRGVLVPNVAARPIRSLAVLPLADLSSGGAQEFFADGMTDELITTRGPNRLVQGHLPDLGHDLQEQTRDAAPDRPSPARRCRPGRLGRALRRPHTHHGAADPGGTDAHLWARTYERDMRDVLALQNDIARSIAQEIRAVLSPAQASRLAQARPVDPEAHTAYLRGLYEWNQRSVTSLQRANASFPGRAGDRPELRPSLCRTGHLLRRLAGVRSGAFNRLLPKREGRGSQGPRDGQPLAEPHAA